MGVRENKIETHLREQMRGINGDTRKWVCPQHNGVPDQILLFKGPAGFAEVKTDDGVLSSVQCREHVKLIHLGCNVIALTGKADVDVFVACIKTNRATECFHTYHEIVTKHVLNSPTESMKFKLKNYIRT